MRIALYPGSFDPITLGHLNIIRRAARIFDALHVCVMVNSAKQTMFTLDERADMIRRTVRRLENVVVETRDDMLLVKHAKDIGAGVIIKGLRAVSDFDWEFQMALANKIVEPDIETLFMTSSSKYTYLSSTVVKEMARYGVDLGDFVPREIIDDILARINK
ncbi:MAG: pantetheine-phosphate adenylyltransferase [Oscillospiraceae bacterium]|jgi:pantetheine-phosphate adenylyltransferase|nr:pantetheine-phosphate adenylyltransferase [Oscillospiraceae bacterium]